MSWVRQGDPKVARITVTIKREQDPDLFDFVQSFQYGKMTQHVKAALRLYRASQGGEIPEATPVATPRRVAPAPTLATPALDSGSPHSTARAPLAPPPLAAAPPVQTPSVANHKGTGELTPEMDPEEAGELTAESLAVLQNFAAQFS